MHHRHHRLLPIVSCQPLVVQYLVFSLRRPVAFGERTQNRFALSGCWMLDALDAVLCCCLMM